MRDGRQRLMEWKNGTRFRKTGVVCRRCAESGTPALCACVSKAITADCSNTLLWGWFPSNVCIETETHNTIETDRPLSSKVFRFRMQQCVRQTFLSGRNPRCKSVDVTKAWFVSKQSPGKMPRRSNRINLWACLCCYRCGRPKRLPDEMSALLFFTTHL